MKTERNKQIADLMEKLKAAELKTNPPISDTQTSVIDSIDVSSDEDTGSNARDQQETIKIECNKEDDNRSGLSLDSNNDDNVPIMNSIKRKR